MEIKRNKLNTMLGQHNFDGIYYDRLSVHDVASCYSNVELR